MHLISRRRSNSIISNPRSGVRVQERWQQPWFVFVFPPIKWCTATFFYLTRFSVYFFSCTKFHIHTTSGHIHRTLVYRTLFPFAFPFHFHSRNERRCRKRCMEGACFHFASGICSARDEMHVRWQNECNSCSILFIFLVKSAPVFRRRTHDTENVNDTPWMCTVQCACVCVAYDSRWSCEEILRSNSRRR